MAYSRDNRNSGGSQSGGAAGILATLVPTGFRQPHMIETMAQGGPSHASGQVQVGDLLLEVDSVDVRTCSLKEIQSKIIGRAGTQVTLTLQRGKHNFSHQVTLTRAVRGESLVPTPRSAEFAPTSPRALSTETDLTARDIASIEARGPDRNQTRSPRRPQTENVLRGPGNNSPRNNSRYIQALSERGAQPKMDDKTVGVPPLFGKSEYSVEGDKKGWTTDTSEYTESAYFSSRELALETKANYWRDKFRSQEEIVSKRGSHTEQSAPIITEMQARIDHLEAELEKSQRSNTPFDSDERTGRLEGQLKVLKVQLERAETARQQEESVRKDIEEQLQAVLKAKGSGDEMMQDRLDKLQAMLDAERKVRAAEEKRVVHLEARLEDLQRLDAERHGMHQQLVELQEALRASMADVSRERRAREAAEDGLSQLQAGHFKGDQLAMQQLKGMQEQLAAARKDLLEKGQALAESEATLRQLRQETDTKKRRMELQVQELQDELDRKTTELHDMKSAGNRMSVTERSSELLDLQKKYRRLQIDLDTAQEKSKEDVREILRLRDLLAKADDSKRLEELQRDLQAEQERRQSETRLKVQEHEARNAAEEALETVRADEGRRSHRLEGMLRKLENDLEMSSDRSKKLEHERHELARALESEREASERMKSELLEQNRKLTDSIANARHDLADVEQKYAKLDRELKDLEASSAKTKARLETRIMQLEEQEAKHEAKLINTRRVMEHEEVNAQKLQRELDDWMDKCSQAEKRRDQTTFTLNRKEEELANTLADAQAERVLRQKLEIENDSLKRDNLLLKDELTNKVQTLEASLAQTKSLLQLEKEARRAAEEKGEELRASVQHLGVKSESLEDISHDMQDRVKAAEASRDRLAEEMEQLEIKLTTANKEILNKLRAAEHEATQVRDQLQESSHERARENRERHALERQLEDAKYECRKIEMLQRRVNDLQVLYQRETTAREEAEQARQKAQKFADSTSEWDRALQEKNQRLEARLETLEKELSTANSKLERAETLGLDLQDALTRDSNKIESLQREVQQLTNENERAEVEAKQQHALYSALRGRFDDEQALARRKAEEFDVVQRRVEELTAILDRDKNIHAQIGEEEERLRKEVELLKRNVIRADEIAEDERKMRQDLQKALDGVRSDYANRNSHDFEGYRQKLEDMTRERDDAIFKAKQLQVNNKKDGFISSNSHDNGVQGKDEELILLLAQNAQRDEELIRRLTANAEQDADTISLLKMQASKDEERLMHFARQLKLAEEALEHGGASRSVSSELEKELFIAQDAVFELKRRNQELHDDNQRLEKALQSAAQARIEIGEYSASAGNSKQIELERQLEHLIKLRTAGEELLSTRLRHAEEDCKRANDRAERAEALLRTRAPEI
jgi:chromosome segregation ATPase